jgi:hypothetical protein
MTNQQAAEIFNQTLVGETDPARIANVEMMREFFCNPEFRAYMENAVAQQNVAQ